MGARCVCPAGKHAEQGVCKSDRPTAPTDGKRYKLKVISGQPGTPGLKRGTTSSKAVEE